VGVKQKEKWEHAIIHLLPQLISELEPVAASLKQRQSDLEDRQNHVVNRTKDIQVGGVGDYGRKKEEKSRP
jgi:hypothetical protein